MIELSTGADVVPFLRRAISDARGHSYVTICVPFIDAILARRIAASGRAAYEREASEAVLGVRWRTIVERLL